METGDPFLLRLGAYCPAPGKAGWEPQQVADLVEFIRRLRGF